MSTERARRRDGRILVVRALAASVAAVLVTASCQAADERRGDATRVRSAEPAAATPASKPSPAPRPPRIRVDVPTGARVAVDTVVKAAAKRATLTDVVVRPAGKGRPLPGVLTDRRSGWRASELLEPGTTYRLRASAVDATGGRVKRSMVFRTTRLTLDEQTYPVITPVDGTTVGVGMPAIVRFDVPVTNRASIERHLRVTSTPRVAGSWHWVNDNEVHWRPKRFWPVGTRVRVDVDINGVPAGNGIYGQLDRAASFQVGSSVISKVNVATNQMRVYVNDTLARTIPITAGKPGFETRAGTKLVVEKFSSLDMDAASVGIKPGDPEYYNIPDVRYAMRLTYSGEFLHAAPWSVAAQGNTNVSHGCVGMSTANARWLFGLAKPGDVVRVTGTDRPLEDGNGWTDWNMPYREYAEGSALS